LLRLSTSDKVYTELLRISSQIECCLRSQQTPNNICTEAQQSLIKDQQNSVLTKFPLLILWAQSTTLTARQAVSLKSHRRPKMITEDAAMVVLHKSLLKKKKYHEEDTMEAMLKLRQIS
jgi:hypothetical protein